MLWPKIQDPQQWVIWFDLDDTLWDFRNNSMETLEEVHRHFMLGTLWPDVKEWKHDYHLVNDAMWEQLARGEISQSELRWRRFYDTFVNKGMAEAQSRLLAPQADMYYLQKLGERENLLPGAADTLSYLKNRGFKIGILSNGFRDVQYNKMKSGGIDGFIDFVVLSDEIGITKPDEGIYRYAEQVAGVSVEHCIMVGDNSDTDIAGCLNAGWALGVWMNPSGKAPGPKLCSCLSRQCALQVIESLSVIRF